MATPKLTPEQTEQKIAIYFEQAPAFAQPICEKLREAIATADPQLKAAWKWNAPVFEKAGPGMVCAVGVFKQHVNLAFMQGALLPDPYHLFPADQDGKGMRSLKFTHADQVNTAYIIEYLKAAVQIKSGTVAKTRERSVVVVPDDLKQALTEAQLMEKFEKLAYTHRKEYVRWVTEAKRAETRSNRIGKTVERITAGLPFS